MSMKRLAGLTAIGVAAALAAALAAAPATAQKAKDTLRLAVSTNIPLLSPYEFPQPNADIFYRDLYDNLAFYNEETKKFEPRLAKSWKYVDDVTIEFVLREDIVFHNGSKMDAEDVVYTLNWSVAPDTKMFLQNRYTGVIKSAEKTGPYTLRLRTVAPTAIDMLRLRSFLVFDSEVHSKLADKSQYGRQGVGTGPMRLAAFEPGRKITMTAFKDFKLGKLNPIGNIEGHIIPDQQTQVAQLLTGGVDVVRDPSRDQLLEMSKRPGLASTVAAGSNLLYMIIDATNRSGAAKPLTDVRVRRALAMAVDRAALIKGLGLPGQNPKPLDALCTDVQIACTYKVKSPSYDPAAAKKLLAEAGYEKGFPLTVSVTTQEREWAEAIVGELRKVGIEASVNPQTTVVLRKDRATGKTQTEMATMPLLALADAHLAYQINLAQPSNDYARDPEIHKLGKAGLSTRDSKAREKIYSDMFDLINEQVYLIPYTMMPDSYLHTAEVVHKGTPGLIFSPRLGDFRWK